MFAQGVHILLVCLAIYGTWTVTSILFVGARLISRAICRSLSSGKPRRRSWQALERILLPR